MQVALWKIHVLAPANSDASLKPDGHRTPDAIDGLSLAGREAFDPVRLQGLTQAAAARMLGVSLTTVKRRLNRGLRLLAEQVERPSLE